MNINSEIVYRVYSIQELRSWLIDNLHNGLSEYAIAPVRAFALINNPCAKDTDPAIVVAFDNDRPIGYSAVFPDDYVKGNTIARLFWGTTEWIEPEYRGKGIAGKMMRAIKDAVGIERYIGLESSIASVKLDQKQGASIVMYNKVRFQFIATDSCKGYLNTKCIVYHNKKQLIRLSDYEYQNEYVSFIDVETHQFIESHARHDLFLRQREMFNWILRYPFMISSHEDTKAQKDICEFGGSVSEYTMEAIKVYAHNELVGFYIVSQTNKDRTLRYLYYDETHQDEVFASATLNLMKPGIEKIFFMSDALQEFMHQQGIKHLNKNFYIDKVTLTLPPNMTVDSSLHIQGGDGDMFC